MRLKGKVALVTGGTRGIGRGIVEMFAWEGACVGFTGRSEDTGRAVEEAVKQAGGKAIWIKADNMVEGDIAAAVEKTATTFGSLTTMVNNAISNDDAASGLDKRVDTLDNRTFENMLRGALMGAVWGSKYSIPHMRRAGNGSIINISASSSVLATKGRPGYLAAKGAINSLTRGMAFDYSKENIRTNTIIVGFIVNGGPEMRKMLENEATKRAMQNLVLVDRFGVPADIAAGAVYLASDESTYVTGIQLTIDGGATCHQAQPEIDMEAITSG